MIASGAGWPAGGPGSSAGTSSGDVGRAGDRPGARNDAVRPVLPTDAATTSTDDRENTGRRHADRQDAGRQAGTANAPSYTAAPGAGPAVYPTGSSRALVPVVPADPPLNSDAARARVHVPVVSAPQLTVGLSAAAQMAIDAAAGGDRGGRAAGATTGAGGSESSGRISPAAATAASDSYRRHGALPTPGIQSGRIFRVSI